MINQGKVKASELDLAIDSSVAKFGTTNKEYVRLATKLMKAYAKAVSLEIMQGMTFRIPMRLGFLKVEKSKSKNNKPINWKLSKELKTRIVHNNFETGGNVYRWKWSKYNRYTIFLNRGLYTFLPTRKNKRNLCKFIQNGVYY